MKCQDHIPLLFYLFIVIYFIIPHLLFNSIYYTSSSFSQFNLLYSSFGHFNLRCYTSYLIQFNLPHVLFNSASYTFSFSLLYFTMATKYHISSGDLHISTKKGHLIMQLGLAFETTCVLRFQAI